MASDPSRRPLPGASSVRLGTGGSRLGNVTGALLLGGASRGMGREAAEPERPGLSGSTRAARLLDDLFEETLLVGGAPEPGAPGRRIRDPEGPPCALRGVVGALAAASGERVVVVANDLPLPSADLLLALTAWPEADAVVPCDARGAQPLCAIYRRRAGLPVAQAHLAEGRLALGALLAALETERVPMTALGFAEPGGDVRSDDDADDDRARREGS